ncbi:hypothetical protein MTO96_039530 [Rhipicephalus appendiculatus]
MATPGPASFSLLRAARHPWSPGSQRTANSPVSSPTDHDGERRGGIGDVRDLYRELGHALSETSGCDHHVPSCGSDGVREALVSLPVQLCMVGLRVLPAVTTAGHMMVTAQLHSKHS